MCLAEDWIPIMVSDQLQGWRCTTAYHCVPRRTTAYHGSAQESLERCYSMIFAGMEPSRTIATGGA
jgi:hypothetical protein